MAERPAAQTAATTPPAVRRVAVVFNPATSPDDAPERERDLHAALDAAGIEVVWLETTKQDPGQGLTRRAVEQGVDLILAAGGDGTVMACVTGLAGSRVPLAVLPGGTGNLLALNLDLPHDLDGALDVALHGDRRDLDVGVLDGGADRFVIMSGLGFDAAMLRDADPALKARIGALAYVLSGLRQLRRRPARFRIRLDDQPTITRIGQGLLIANLARLQGGLTLAPDAQPDDGLLDVAVLGTRTPVDWLRLAAQVLLRRQRHGQIQQRRASPPGSAGPPWLPVELFRARRVEVDCDRPQPVERDGDPAGSTRRLVVEILPRALTLCVPARAEESDQEDNP
jgi:diacylglycerol kinase family enzyme